MQPIRVIWIDSDDLKRAAILRALEDRPDLELVARVTDFYAAINLCYTHNPDIVILDIPCPQNGIINTIRKVKDDHPECQLLVISNLCEKAVIQDFIRAGASGYLLNDTPLDDIIHLLRSAHNGHLVLSPEVIQILLSED